MEKAFLILVLSAACCGWAAAEGFKWSEKTAMPVSARNGAAVCAGEKIFFMGGSGSLVKNYEYDPGSNAWTKRTNLLTNGWNMAPVFLDGKIYLFGGDPFLARSEVYDVAADSWKKLKPLPTPRQHLKGAAVDGRIYMLGGLEKGTLTAKDSFNDWDGKALVSAKNEMYDPRSDSWKELAPLPVPMHSPNAYVVAIGKLIYVMGGMGDGKSIWTDLKTLEVYNTETNKWELKKDLPFSFFAGAAAVDNTLYALGSDDDSGKGKLAAYDPAADAWKILGDIPVLRSQAGVASHHRSIYIIGGNDSRYTPYADVFEITLN